MTSAAIIDRIARAAQDCRYVFGEPVQSTMTVNGREVACESIPTLHSPGPHALAEQREARLAAQAEANRLLAGERFDEARDLLVAVADAETAAWPQYAGKWEGYTLGVATRRTTFKGGREVAKGDAVLLGELSAWDDDSSRDWSAFCARMGGGIALPERNAALRPVAF